MDNQNIELNIGDKIGFVLLASGIDGKDETIFFPVVEVTERDNERAYFYQYPDGSVSRAAITQSALIGHPVQIEARIDSKMICLNNRKNEFREALERGKDNKFEVYSDWDKDAFVVVNQGNKAEYRVKLDNARGEFYSSCECPDFQFKKRLCKHIAEVLTFALMKPTF